MDHQALAQLLGNYGEFVGALAVVSTLAYLARQIRDQNRAHEIATFEGVMDGLNQLNAMFGSDKALYRLFMTGLNAPEQLEDDEAGAFSFLFRMYMNSYNKMHRAYLRGTIEEQSWIDFAAEAAEMITSPGGKKFFATQKRWAYVEAVLQHRREDSVVDLSLGREPLRRAS